MRQDQIQRLAMAVLAAAVLVGAVLGCGEGRDGDGGGGAKFGGAAGLRAGQLAEHSRHFERRIVEVTDGVYVAIGYGLANSILLSGDGCRVIVDTMESVEIARQVRAAFDELDPSPIAALVYTHNHADHTFGARGFAEGGEPEVVAHATTGEHLDRVLSVLRPILRVRSARMFGSHLDAAGLVNAGIGPFLGLDASSTVGVLRPTVTFEERLELELCGLRLELVHAPGETDDQLFVWLPEKRVLLPGDNLYRAFPNLYTIRGTAYRDVLAWVASLDAMRERRPEFLVPSHTGPIQGADAVAAVLTDYRDAIQFVHDQAVRGMNLGLTSDELAATLELPPHLATSPWLQELYGEVAGSVRSIFSGYLGWFDGNPTHLRPHPPGERARRMAALAGGEAALLERARASAAEGDAPWVLELTDHLLRLDPESAAAKELRVAALLELGEAEENPNVRHYLLTMARELEGGWRAGLAIEPSREVVRATPLAAIFRSLAVHLDPQASAEIDRRVVFVFPDLDEAWTLHVRRGVAEVRSRRDPAAEVTVTVSSVVWKELLAGLRSPVLALASGELRVDGGVFDLVAFLGLFEAGDEPRE